MATRSKPKNFPPEPERGKRPGFDPINKPAKAHPGYPGYGPALGPAQDAPHPQVNTARTPSGAEKYYPEWRGKNTKSNQLAESERLAAERLLHETQELISETKQKAKQDAQEVETRFRQRVDDIAFWRSELEAKLAELQDAWESVDCQRARVEHALGSCGEPLSVVEQCLAHRNQRQGVDRVDDNVQKHLRLEAETLQNSQVLLKQTKLQLAEEQRQLKKCRHAMAKDLQDKEAAMDIDQQTAQLKVTGPDKKKGVTRYAVATKNSVYSPADWQEHSERNLQLASGQLKSTLALQSTCDGVLAHVSAHLKSQKDLTDRAFDRRIKEVKEAKLLLEQQLSETTVKLSEVEESIQALEKTIGAKQAPLATCQLKIQQRKQRPNVELVLDDVDVQLQNEAQNLVDSVNRLEAHLAKSRDCYASLQKSKLELEAQIGVKANSIFIDEVKCMTVRQSVVIQAY